MNINDMTSQQIEQYLHSRNRKESMDKLLKETQIKESFKSRKNLDIYEASDYCGMSIGKYHFYYGYEATHCDRHGDNSEECHCYGKEWCFTAKIDNEEVLRIPRSELWYDESAPITWYLLSGIGQYFNKAGGL